jgi:hypothetical protein
VPGISPLIASRLATHPALVENCSAITVLLSSATFINLHMGLSLTGMNNSGTN